MCVPSALDDDMPPTVAAAAPLDRVLVNGVVLASVLTDSATSDGDVDGVLFGVARCRRDVRLTDADGTRALACRPHRVRPC